MSESFPPPSSENYNNPEESNEKINWPTDPEAIKNTMKQKLQEYVNENEWYLTGSMLKEKLQEYLQELAESMDLDYCVNDEFFDNNIEDEHESFMVNDYEGEVRGKISFLGIELFKYGHNPEGEQGDIDEWYDDNFKQAIEKYIKETLI